MFTGFATENTPAIQIWDFFRTFASSTSPREIALAGDCAPIQYFRTGASTTDINVYLPTAPIDGKIIKICNSKQGSSAQKVVIYSSDMTFGFTSAPYIVGQGQTLDLCYSINCITYNISALTNSGWISLNNVGSTSALNYNAFSIGFNSSASASGAISFGNSNNASGSNSTVSGGGSNTASNTYATVSGGNTNTASGNSSIVAGGNSQTSSGQDSAIIGGSDNIANAKCSIILSGASGTTRGVVGNCVMPASSFPVGFSVGNSQTAILILGAATTNATATVLKSDVNAAGTTNQVILPNNSAYVFQGTCIANITGGSTTSGWKYEGVIKRGANAASTTLVAAVTPTVIAQDVAAATWVLAITADTTNGCIKVQVTGVAATTIRWVSRIETTEVTY